MCQQYYCGLVSVLSINTQNSRSFISHLLISHLLISHSPVRIRVNYTGCLGKGHNDCCKMKAGI